MNEPTNQTDPQTPEGHPIRPSSWERERRRWRRGVRIGVVGTLVFHLLLFLIRTPLDPPDWRPPGPGEEDRMVVIGGGSELQQVTVQVERPETSPEEEPEEIIPVPAEVPQIDVEVDPDDVAGPPSDPGPPVLGAPPGAGEGEGETEGPERGDGTADGDGEGGGAVAPTPIRVPTPPTGVPASARGQEISIFVFVNATGRVVPDSTRLDPPTSDRRFNTALRQHAQDYIFEPGRENGRAVSSWFRIDLDYR